MAPNILPNYYWIISLSIHIKIMRYLLGSLIVSLVRLTFSSNATRIGRQKLHTMIHILVFYNIKLPNTILNFDSKNWIWAMGFQWVFILMWVYTVTSVLMSYSDLLHCILHYTILDLQYMYIVNYILKATFVF